jgi:hypothetical protein
MVALEVKDRGFPGLARRLALAGTMVLAVLAGAAPGLAANHCLATADALFRACGFEVQDDVWVATAKCLNLEDAQERAECNTETAAERRHGERECRAQRSWRSQACGALGPSRYDPDFDPELFDTDFAHLTHPNPYFPLTIGNTWGYRSAHETNVLEVLNEFKRIDGVRCVVVRDQVFRDGRLKEDTDDWYAQAKNGDVWYCGEEVKDYQSFNGDVPKLPELVSIDGSFKAGREGDKPGIIFLIAPHPGDAYTEEFSPGNAEDVTEILSTTYDFGQDPELDELVPRALADALCAGDCVVTKNYSLLEPGIFARKYYAPGIGVFLEVEPDIGEVVRLTTCNFDPRCATLPQP